MKNLIAKANKPEESLEYGSKMAMRVMISYPCNPKIIQYIKDDKLLGTELVCALSDDLKFINFLVSVADFSDKQGLHSTSLPQKTIKQLTEHLTALGYEVSLEDAEVLIEAFLP